MTTYKRVNGDYEIVALNSGTISLNTPLVTVNIGSLTAPLGNIDAGNLQALNQVLGTSATFTGNISAANVNVSGNAIIAGNVTADYFLGDGSFLTNVTAISNLAVTQIANTSTVFAVQSSGGSLTAQVGGVANVLVITSSSVTAGNLITNSIRSDDSSFVQIVDGLQVLDNIETEGNLIVAGYLFGNGSQLQGIDATSIQNGTSNVKVTSSGGNVTTSVGGAANVLVITSIGANVAGTLGVTGNITGNYVLGNGSQLTGIDATSIQSGTSNVKVVSSGGNVTVGIANTSNVVVVSTTGANITGVLGVTGTITGGNLSTAGTLAAGITTITGNLNVTGNVNATGNLNYQNVTDLVVGDPLIYIGANNVGDLDDLGFVANWDDGVYQHGGLARDATDGIWKLFGNVIPEPTTVINFTNAIYQPFRAGNITTTGLLNANANGVGNIGNSSVYFNTVFAKATSAQYADVAELYLADQEYAPGTVLCFGGSAEVTISNHANDHRVAGVVSTNPAHLMNSALVGLHPVKLALVGRVPCQVRGPVQSGDILVSAEHGWAQVNNQAQAGRVIGKSLENSTADGTIEIVVGKH
jgi:hypothetical protein